jgi:hypothetical protein
MNLPRRALNIIARPRDEWPIIARERDDVPALYVKYIGPLAIIPAASVLIGLLRVGGRFLGVVGMTTAVMAALVGYALSLASPLIAALLIERLAPSFKARGTTAQTLKLVAYSWTPVWMASVFYVSVTLAPLVMLGILWAIYLYFVGLPIVLETPHEQVVPFALVSGLAVVVATIVLRALVASAGIPSY